MAFNASSGLKTSIADCIKTTIAFATSIDLSVTATMARAPKKATIKVLAKAGSAYRANNRKSSKKNYYRKKALERPHGPRSTLKRTKDVINEKKNNTGLNKFIVKKMMKTTNKEEMKAMKKWKDILNAHIKVFCRPLFETTIGKKRRELTGEEIPHERTYTIKFLKNSWHASGGEWIDLFEVKKSQIPNSGMGLYALQSFNVGDRLGLFYGTIYTEDREMPTNYSMRNTTRKIIVDPRGPITSKHPTYFGLHFANDPLQSKAPKKIKTRSEKKGIAHNFFVDEDYLAIACCEIKAGQELFLNYGWNVSDEDCTCDGCNCRRKDFCVASD